MNPLRKIADRLMNWWKGETAPEVSDSTELTGGVMTLNSPSFLESMGLSRKRKTTSEVTYFTCLKMLSETLAKMPIKYYQKTDKGIIEAVDIPQSSFSCEYACIIHNNLNTIRLHHPQVKNFDLSSVFLPDEFLSHVHISVSVMIPVDFNRVPKYGWCHERVRSFGQ